MARTAQEGMFESWAVATEARAMMVAAAKVFILAGVVVFGVG